MNIFKSNRSADHVEAALIARDHRARWFKRSFASCKDAYSKRRGERRPNPLMMRGLHIS